MRPPSCVRVFLQEIGRASCRGRVEILGGGATLKKKAGMGDVAVSGVQTCALPISRPSAARGNRTTADASCGHLPAFGFVFRRSEERRVGEEWRSWGVARH